LFFEHVHPLRVAKHFFGGGSFWLERERCAHRAFGVTGGDGLLAAGDAKLLGALRL
jgi:hypothetical protein